MTRSTRWHRILSETALDLAAPVLAQRFYSPPLPPGTTVGAYRLLREIGRGGMGQVYLAERLGDASSACVALKLLNEDLESARAVHRFQAEAATLAAMNHSGIARLLDAGTSADGIPFLVMEYVDGLPIDRYCERHKCSLEDRLILFIQLCEIVEHVHRKGVVHRDLKPSNIFITEHGEVRLLDFGISKLLEADPADATTTAVRLLTPEFASPEQVVGGPVSPATDVYGLGVLLYLLLSGRLPYPDSAGRDSIGRAILTLQPAPPSAAGTLRALEETASGETVFGGKARRAEPRAMTRLTADLDAIVLKALRKDPVDRFAGAGSLASALREHMALRTAVAQHRPLSDRLRALLGRDRTV